MQRWGVSLVKLQETLVLLLSTLILFGVTLCVAADKLIPVDLSDDAILVLLTETGDAISMFPELNTLDLDVRRWLRLTLIVGPPYTVVGFLVTAG